MKLATVCRSPIRIILQQRGGQCSSFSSEIKLSHPIEQTQQAQKRRNKLNYAILIDADHGQHRKMRLILDEIHALHVNPLVRRVYGDFTIGSNSRWKEVCQKHSIIPIQAYSFVSGKATTDFAMMIDAMDLLYTNPALDGFVIMSGDSDFCRLAQRLREAGKHVIGVGEVSEYHPFPRSCNVYISSDKLFRKPMVHETVVVPVEESDEVPLEMLPPPPPMEVNAVEKEESGNLSKFNWIPQRVFELWYGSSLPEANINATSNDNTRMENAQQQSTASTTDALVVAKEPESLVNNPDKKSKKKNVKEKKKKSRRRRK